jgi:LPXTG-site transpeptidase (sortase) family protein
VLPGTATAPSIVPSVTSRTRPTRADGTRASPEHRDGFFRGLKDIVRGDAIELETLDGKEYRVERTWVSTEDVSVLDPTSTRALTLVTCFYFVGSAPRRFIVRAVRVSDKPLP